MMAFARGVSSHNASRFLLVGGVSYLFDVGSLITLHGVLHMALPVATTMSYAATLAVNFGLNRAFAFRSGGLFGRSLLRYLALLAVNYVVTVLLVTGLTAAGMSYVVAKTQATVMIAATNYFAYRWWVFKATDGIGRG
jgi:putative flippase GtrA